MIHCFFEVNKYTDTLARRGCVSDQDFVFFDSPLMDLGMLFYDN